MRFRISKIKNENWRNYEQCGISNGRTKPKFANFWNQIMVFQIEKKFPNFKISKIITFPLLTNSKKIIKVLKLLDFKKLANFFNLTIFKTIKIQKISNLMVNYQICILSVRII